MISELRFLWRGKLPFVRAFWGHAVINGFAINAAMSAFALLGYIFTGSASLFVLLHSLPLPYNVVACIGAWRSTDWLNGEPWRRGAARFAVLAVFAALLLV